MPLKRTPPASPLPETSAGTVRRPGMIDKDCFETIQHCESMPDLPSITVNMSERKKRKHDGMNPNITSFITDIFTSFSQDQGKLFNELNKTIMDIKEQNEELKKSVDMMSHKYDEFLSRISALELERKEDKKIISQLEEKIEKMEQKSRCAAIEIRNIPKTNEETKSNLCSIIKNVGKVLNLDLIDSDIKDIYRISSKDLTNPIVVEFSTVIMKEKMIKGVKLFNKSKMKGDKLNTTHLKYATAAKPVYVSETLTQKTQKLFYLARNFAKNYNYNFCWTSRGAVYLRKNENSSQVRINSQSDIDNLGKFK
ncbi:unnamed protein product [Euphydryas editha]|uniref:FP protein C-terminal domain-containing protein n=1 Tax=Euphydryas editha TaxID=104508 RepID=A0AAU9UEQ4_EUPED|nr:unnamed protein product [Euphydryas editha]